MDFFRFKSLRPPLLMLTLALAACSNDPYPLDIQQELHGYCSMGIKNGLLTINGKPPGTMTDDEIKQLCHFRLSELMQEVSFDEYQQLHKEIYENFQRAYAMKMRLVDIYDTLSPNAKRTNATIARILFGLEPSHAK